MSPGLRSKIQSTFLVAAVAVAALIFGVMLDDKVVPGFREPLMSGAVVEQGNSKSPKEENEMAKTAQQNVGKSMEQQAGEIKLLDQKSEVVVTNAENLIAKADALIAKSGVRQQAASKQIPTEDKKIADRLVGVRSRLDALKK